MSGTDADMTEHGFRRERIVVTDAETRAALAAVRSLGRAGVADLIEKGKITEMLEDVAYQANTQEFWNSCAGSCDESDFRFFGAFNDGKGQPSQSSAVSHGSATTRFNGVNVINTARKIG